MTTLRTGPLGQRVCWALSAAFVATLAACGGGGDSGVRESPKAIPAGFPIGTPSTMVSAGGVTPYIIAGANNGGNRTCAEVGLAFYGNADYFKYSSTTVNYGGGGTANDPDTPWLKVTTDGTAVTWYVDGSIPDADPARGPSLIGAAIVKGSNDANVYVYDPQSQGDSGLTSPVNASTGNAGLSNITFCWNYAPIPGNDGEWCSPGYWRQPQHLGSWLLTGYKPEDLYVDKIGPLPTAINRKPKECTVSAAPASPTLGQVLRLPQCYGGDAFNAVGDLLSAAHPDVNFTGERVEDRCPLGLDPGQ
jgi:hypothetical protein